MTWCVLSRSNLRKKNDESKEKSHLKPNTKLDLGGMRPRRLTDSSTIKGPWTGGAGVFPEKSCHK